MTMKLVAGLALATLVVGCASSGSNQATGGMVSPAAQQANASESGRRSSPNFMTAEDLASTGETNALKAIERGRPAWLRAGGGNRGNRASSSGRSNMGWDAASNALVVYFGDKRMGASSTLETIQLSTVKEIQYLSSQDATNKYGAGHGGGVILVVPR